MFAYVIYPERFVKFDQCNIVGKSATSVIILMHYNFLCLACLPSAIHFDYDRKNRIMWLVWEFDFFQSFPEFSSCLSASISLIPAWILTLLGFLICRPCMQWAAVRTHWGWIRVPPQNWLHSEPHPLFSSNATIHGVCPGANLTPFIIRPWISASSSGFKPFQKGFLSRFRTSRASTNYEPEATKYALSGEIRGDLNLITSIIEFIVLWALFFTFWTGKGFLAFFLFTFNLLKLSFAFLFQKDSKFLFSQISTSYRAHLVHKLWTILYGHFWTLSSTNRSFTFLSSLTFFHLVQAFDASTNGLFSFQLSIRSMNLSASLSPSRWVRLWGNLEKFSFWFVNPPKPMRCQNRLENQPELFPNKNWCDINQWFHICNLWSDKDHISFWHQHRHNV